MKAVSLRQPWASAVAWGGKRLENRLERSSAITQIRAVVGQRVAIHASLSKPSQADREGVFYAIRQNLPASWLVGGAIVATALVRDVVRGTGVGWGASERGEAEVEWPRYQMLDADIERLPELLGPDWRQQLQAWWLGPLAIVLAEVRGIRDPVLCKGALGWWSVPADVEAEVLARGGAA